MLSNSSRYGIRAAIYLASRQNRNENTGLKQISTDLNLPMPFMAKILQQLAKNRILRSVKGPNGGFSLLKNPGKITLYDIVEIIDGKDLFVNCIIHDDTCAGVRKSKKPCPVHEDYTKVRSEIIKLFRTRTIAELAARIDALENVII
jgi:Rrf2 family transcriptional regulator, iron-sulfur cluster assembly transcription factor